MSKKGLFTINSKLNKRVKTVTMSSILAIVSGCSLPILNNNPIEQSAYDDLQNSFKISSQPTASLTLDEAIARAIKYNLKTQASRMEEALQYGLKNQVKYDMLPQLTAQAGYNVRNNEDASIGKTIADGNVSTDHSTSTEKDVFTTDLQLVWNFLDFGMAYLNAQDQGQRAIIAIQQHRQSILTLTTQVQSAYWKAATAQQHLPNLKKLIRQAEVALNRSRSLQQRQVQNPKEALDYQQNLLESLESLIGIRSELEQAQQSFAQLIHLAPGAPYTLEERPKIDTIEQLNPEKLFPNARIRWMEDQAIERSPLLWQSELELSISGNAIRKELFSLFPGVSLSSGVHNTSNMYTFNPAWLNVGLTLAWNVFNVLSAPERINNAKQKRAIARMKRLTTAMSVITQLHLARQTYYNRYQKLQISNELLKIQLERERIILAEVKAKVGTQQQQTQNRANMIFAEIKRDLAYAEMKNALGQLFHTLGMDPVSHDIASSDITTIAHFIQTQRNHNYYKIMRGTLTPITVVNRKTVSSKQLYSVQVGVYQSSETAKVLAMGLRRQGYSPIIWQERWSSNKIWHHVILGEYKDRERAEVFASDLAHRQNIPSITIRIPSHILNKDE
ncbi:MAG: TolC family protein [Thiotrichales bacterium]|jgi:outer membrane protein TolC|nr:TolC family protein [Thiotrichales bacterium]MBT3836689.1 TolC family protein [Thiotrichales bacterium]MBT4574460.1 TolC family protein [Thiotrichales bacterium]MBT4971362.1 TolC family protein [Thiotrichales bacterium]MBT5290615.1 TolC family protein [Thiotrichales bacterium]